MVRMDNRKNRNPEDSATDGNMPAPILSDRLTAIVCDKSICFQSPFTARAGLMTRADASLRAKDKCNVCANPGFPELSNHYVSQCVTPTNPRESRTIRQSVISWETDSVETRKYFQPQMRSWPESTRISQAVGTTAQPRPPNETVRHVLFPVPANLAAMRNPR